MLPIAMAHAPCNTLTPIHSLTPSRVCIPGAHAIIASQLSECSSVGASSSSCSSLPSGPRWRFFALSHVVHLPGPACFPCAHRLAPPHALHRRRCCPCSQMLAPPHSLHVWRCRPCSQMLAPPHSLHWWRRRPCSHGGISREQERQLLPCMHLNFSADAPVRAKPR